MATASPEAKLATYRVNCQGYGYLAGTPEMAKCMQQEAGDYRDSASSSMSAMADSMAHTSRPRAVTTTNCTSYGDTVRCSSY